MIAQAANRDIRETLAARHGSGDHAAPAWTRAWNPEPSRVSYPDATGLLVELPVTAYYAPSPLALDAAASLHEQFAAPVAAHLHVADGWTRVELYDARADTRMVHVYAVDRDGTVTPVERRRNGELGPERGLRAHAHQLRAAANAWREHPLRERVRLERLRMGRRDLAGVEIRLASSGREDLILCVPDKPQQTPYWR